MKRYKKWGAFVAVLVLFVMAVWWGGQTLKKRAEIAVAVLKEGAADVQRGDFISARSKVSQANVIFSSGAFWLSPLRLIPSGCSRFPGCSELLAAEAVFSMGTDGTEAALATLSLAEKVLRANAENTRDTLSMLDLFETTKQDAKRAYDSLERADHSRQRINPAIIPAEFQPSFADLNRALPLAVALLGNYIEHQSLFEELLGAHGPRTYLFLFQNNQELRATGGFIGSYALLDVNAGKLRRFFVDGIFNPDGQLKENIVPPKPIQKISAGWSLHDSNWFPDFPTSAEKAMFFYEKTGGPTVDGIITLTPEVLGRLLKLVGPVTLPEYGVTVDADNFLSIIQEEVEVKYDKEENDPKRILGDLTEALLKRFISFDHPKETWELGNAMADLLNERHILIYSRNTEVERLIRAAGWSGEVLSAPHDYLSVIHTNINGYKTDGVLDEVIRHEAEIQSDGRVIDTVTITRTHRGGQTPYEWWNKVNADYLRVYVPEGSKLISAEGMTREFPEAPLDYAALGFRRDGDIEREEQGTRIDEASGTRVSTDAGKTVFGNWVYVSPGESVTVRYAYELPFRVDPHRLPGEENVKAYSVLYQKQSGSVASTLKAVIHYPETLKPVWQTPENLIPYQRTFEVERPLSRDFYWGIVFGQQAEPER
ncbi:MAG: DUF4012 domain-containing protein [Undibacterium sp.]